MAGTGPMVIVGGGLAAARAVETFRSEGFDGEIVVICAEDELPYERPPLSKGLLLGKDERSSVFPHDRAWYNERRVDLRIGVAATAIDTFGRSVALADGSTVGYHRLLLATGSTARRLSIPGADAGNVLTLRTLADNERLQAALKPGGRRLVVIGAGWIGLEVTAAAREYGNEVVVIESAVQPLLAALGPELGAVFAQLHTDHGVDLRLGTGVGSLVVQDGAVTSVRTTAGDELPADLVLIGVGAAPETALAEAAGLTVDDGIVVDAALRTSDPNIWAAGDVANVVHPFYGRPVRVEHWSNADASGPLAAKAMLEQAVSFDHLPFFYTDQYDLGMEFTGMSADADAVHIRGDLAGREFIAFWTAGGQLIGGMNVNVWDVAEQIERLIRSRAVVDPAKLVDPEIPIYDVTG